MLQKTLDYRERIRRVKEEEKLKWGMALHGLDIKKPPRVMRETEAVERELDNLVSNPQEMGLRPPDFRALTERVLKAFVNQPFECHRTIPEADVDAQHAMAVLENATFQPEEIRHSSAPSNSRPDGLVQSGSAIVRAWIPRFRGNDWAPNDTTGARVVS